jgi:hypothetical protein
MHQVHKLFHHVVSKVDHTHTNHWRTLVLRDIPKSAGNALDQLIRFNRFFRLSKPHLQFPSPSRVGPSESSALAPNFSSWKVMCF